MPRRFTRSAPGGFLEPLPQNARDEMARRFPQLPIEAVEREYGFYLLMREAMKETPSPAEMKDELESLADLMQNVVARTGKTKGTVLERMTWREGIYAFESMTPIADMQLLAYALTLAIPRAIAELPTGHLEKPEHALNRKLAMICRECSMEADATRRGTLVALTGIVLEVTVENAYQLVRHALKDWGKKGLKPGWSFPANPAARPGPCK